jgi:hypothetical protein
MVVPRFDARVPVDFGTYRDCRALIRRGVENV